MIERLVKLHFRPEAIEEFEEIYKNGRPTILGMPGCLHVEAWQAIDQPHVYFTYSRWIDETCLNNYRGSEFFGITWKRTKALFDAKPEAYSTTRLSELAAPAKNHQRLVLDDYHIDFGHLASEQFSWLSSLEYPAWVIIVDELTQEHCLPHLQPFLADKTVHVICVPSGELNKQLSTTQYIWEELFRLGAGRRWCVLNLGGGVIGDMGGFAAATFKRGIDFVQIPTTLLSQVDASVGGKLGIDFNGLKNSIGVFSNPKAVWIDPGFLKTLPERELRSGYAEVIKHALIADADQWAQLQEIEELVTADWQSIIPASVAIKHRIVQQDPMERGLRKALNYGHTIGHAIESYWLHTEDRLLHGEAIAAGMIAEAWLSTNICGLPINDLLDIADYLLCMYGHQEIPEEAFDQLIETMQQDKKNDDARINFSLLATAGECVVNQTADAALIRKSLAYYNSMA